MSPGLSSRLIITSVTWPTLHGIIGLGLWPSSKLLFGDKSILQSGQTAIWLTVIVQCPSSPLTISDRCPSASDRLIIRETSSGHTPQSVPFKNNNKTNAAQLFRSYSTCVGGRCVLQYHLSKITIFYLFFYLFHSVPIMNQSW